MVDRIKRYKNHERWPRDWENICREGDEFQLRPDSLDANGSTLAHFAAQRENPAPLFRCLKDLGTNLIRPNKDPLAALTVLHDIGADMKMVTRHRQTALHLVASSCAPSQLESTVKFLIKNDVDPQQMDDDGRTMLHYINERNDIPRRQKEQICTLVNPYQNGPFSPRSSSGFSEKMSMDYCDQIMYPEYPVNCSPMTSTPLITRTTQIPSAACSAPPPPLAPTSCSSSSTSCCSINVPQKLLQLGTTHQPTTITITTPSSRYPQSVKEQEPDEPLATLLTNKETQTECYRDQEMESLKSRLRELEAERDDFSRQCKRMSERLERYESCQICLEPYSASERVTLRSCGHMMCTECAHKWLRETPQCPQCRADYTRGDLVKSLIH